MQLGEPAIVQCWGGTATLVLEGRRHRYGCAEASSQMRCHPSRRVKDEGWGAVRATPILQPNVEYEAARKTPERPVSIVSEAFQQEPSHHDRELEYCRSSATHHFRGRLPLSEVRGGRPPSCFRGRGHERHDVRTTPS